MLVSYPFFFSKVNRFDKLGVLSLVEEKSEDVKKTGSAGEHLLAGEKIEGIVKSSENNYKVNQFQPDQYSTFGFPVMPVIKALFLMVAILT